MQVDGGGVGPDFEARDERAVRVNEIDGCAAIVGLLEAGVVDGGGADGAEVEQDVPPSC